MPLTTRKITVLGGGIAGLTVAMALARHGAEVHVLEQSPEIREVGAGLQISPNGTAVLKELGLERGLAEVGVRGEGVVLRDYRRGRQVLRLDLTRKKFPYYFVHRADLINLLAHAAREAGVQIRLLHEITGLELDSSGVRLTSAQGATLNADLLIGADGLHSVVRSALNRTTRPFFTGQVAWRAVVPADGPVPAVATNHMGPGRHFVHYPLRRGELINIVAVEERGAWTNEGWNRRDDPDNLRAAFAGFAPEVRALLDKVEDVYLWGLFRHSVAACWHKGPATILGDAAHPTLPFLAQGAVMAIEDAWVLSQALVRYENVGEALSRYQALRRPRALRVVDLASKNARAYHLGLPVIRDAAHMGLRLAGLLGTDFHLSRFNWLYDYDITKRQV
ncbi:salicylate hydroxylase [Rhodovulum imhoffii]|uniref:Salicylate hydroxylase n=1 Tax=Rhodovulum imhoffii TaxID=365340 RepID=A0A2T5BVP3_9RHOB|nr:FAD-dependent monooxygenase [Rhodovulum imhoffii]MBK5932782.1 monooxygenase [Rhodovulum imhoffii]PTN03649.1 salicylate hydroxylase [Rhodovulum imhoffii]